MLINSQNFNTIFKGKSQEKCSSDPQKPFVIYDGQEWTFRDMNEFSNRIANLFQRHGYKNGDVVGLFMENRPAIFPAWSIEYWRYRSID